MYNHLDFSLQFDTKFASKQQRLTKISTILWLLLSTQISFDWLRARYVGEKANITKHTYPVVDSYNIPHLPQKTDSFKSKRACIGEENGKSFLARQEQAMLVTMN